MAFFSHNIPRIAAQTKLKSIFGKCDSVGHCKMLCVHAEFKYLYNKMNNIFFLLISLNQMECA